MTSMVGILLPMLLVHPCWSMATIQLGRASNAPMELGFAETISVEISGLLAGDEIEFVATTVAFDGGLFSQPAISLGALIPDESGFTSAVDVGIADAIYDGINSAMNQTIDSNGVFYTFDVIPTSVGSGQFNISFADLAGTDAAGASLDHVVGAALVFDVIPEPKSIALFWWGLLLPFGTRIAKSHRFVEIENGD